jgi:hypothetical protein
VRYLILSLLLFGCDTSPPSPLSLEGEGGITPPSASSPSPFRERGAGGEVSGGEVVPASTAPPTAEVPPAAPPAKRGLWIWEFHKKAPSPERSAELAASWGVGRVFIKGGNGNERRRWAQNARPENLAPFLERGIEVWIFGYFYSPDIPDADGRTWGTVEEQVEATMRTITPGVTGLVVDAEEEFKDRPKEAEQLCKLLRARLAGKSLAYTSYGWIKPNKRFPFATFDRHCGDAFLPQVYYAFGWPGGLEASMDRLERETRELGLRAPMWPIQSNERDPDLALLQRFFDRAGPDASVFYLHPEDTPQSASLAKLKFR